MGLPERLKAIERHLSALDLPRGCPRCGYPGAATMKALILEREEDLAMCEACHRPLDAHGQPVDDLSSIVVLGSVMEDPPELPDDPDMRFISS